MIMKLNPYGSQEFAGNVAKVGKGKSPKSLADRMPTAELAAKVGAVGVEESTARQIVRLTAKY